MVNWSTWAPYLSSYLVLLRVLENLVSKISDKLVNCRLNHIDIISAEWRFFLLLCENWVNELSWRIKNYKKHLSETKQNSFPVWKHMLSKFSQISFTLWSSWYDTFCLNKSSSLYFLTADLRNNLLCCIILMCLVWWFDRHIKWEMIPLWE